MARGSDFAVHYGPIRLVFAGSNLPAQCCKSLKDLVELVGIEPTTSSLRTMRSPSSAIAPWGGFHAFFFFFSVLPSAPRMRPHTTAYHSAFPSAKHLDERTPHASNIGRSRLACLRNSVQTHHKRGRSCGVRWPRTACCSPGCCMHPNLNS